MKASDLRIGNWVHSNSTNTDFQADLNTLGLCDQQLMTNPPKPICEPIPLTEEWLLKFGFKLVEESHHKFPTHKDLYDKTKIVERLDKTYFITQSDDHEPDGTEMNVLVILDPGTFTRRSVSIVEVRDNFIHAEMQYVHQLQNLYFALTGTELELSPLTSQG